MAGTNTQSYQAGGQIIKIDRKKCISCGLCETLAPKTFKMDKDFKSTVLEKGPYDSPAKIKEAAQNCAVEAITVEQAKD